MPSAQIPTSQCEARCSISILAILAVTALLCHRTLGFISALCVLRRDRRDRDSIEADSCQVSPCHRSIQDRETPARNKITTMSGFWYEGSWIPGDYDLSEAFADMTDVEQQGFPAVAMPIEDHWYQPPLYTAQQPILHQPQPQHPMNTNQNLAPDSLQQQQWSLHQEPTHNTYQSFRSQSVSAFPPFNDHYNLPSNAPQVAGPSAGYLSPNQAMRPRPARAHSATASITSSTRSFPYSAPSRSVSPSITEMSKWGTQLSDGSWKCSYVGCNSRSTFTRGCDLRKHYKRHTKTLFCRQEGCPQASEGGFSSRKDRARHEAKHNPTVRCEWEDCPRLFSRVDNMVCFSMFCTVIRANRRNRKITYEECTNGLRSEVIQPLDST